MPTVGAHIDTSRRLEILQNPLPFALFAGFFGVLTLIFLALIVFIWGEPDQFRRFVDWLMVAGVLLFGLFTAYTLRRAALGRVPVVWIAPEGFSNWICAPIVIPWSGITRITMHTGRGAHLRMALSEDVARQFRPSWLRRNLQKLNTMHLRPTLLTSPTGLKISLQDLYDTTKAYAKAHGGPTA